MERNDGMKERFEVQIETRGWRKKSFSSPRLFWKLPIPYFPLSSSSFHSQTSSMVETNGAHSIVNIWFVRHIQVSSRLRSLLWYIRHNSKLKFQNFCAELQSNKSKFNIGICMSIYDIDIIYRNWEWNKGMPTTPATLCFAGMNCYGTVQEEKHQCVRERTREKIESWTSAKLKYFQYSRFFSPLFVLMKMFSLCKQNHSFVSRVWFTWL